MNYLWVDDGNDPNWDLVKHYRMNGLYFACFDQRLTKTYIDQVKARGFVVGLYMAWNWEQTKNLSGPEQMELFSERLGQIAGPNPAAGHPKIQWNNEEKDTEMIASGLERWRQLRPKHDTSWTLEGMQGGWFSPEFVKRILATKVRIVPQCYRGDMSKQYDVLAAARDLTKRGIPDNVISPFYDAAILDRLEYWDGFAFTMGRLPAVTSG